MIYTVIVAGVVLTPTAANALTSYEGSDYSQDYNSLAAVRACDEESDSHGVHADYHKNFIDTNYKVYDHDGAHNACGSVGFGGSVTQHRIVEEVNVSPDQFGPWVYPA